MNVITRSKLVGDLIIKIVRDTETGEYRSIVESYKHDAIIPEDVKTSIVGSTSDDVLNKVMDILKVHVPVQRKPRKRSFPTVKRDFVRNLSKDVKEEIRRVVQIGAVGTDKDPHYEISGVDPFRESGGGVLNWYETEEDARNALAQYRRLTREVHLHKKTQLPVGHNPAKSDGYIDVDGNSWVKIA